PPGRPPRSPLSPYTTLFRSLGDLEQVFLELGQLAGTHQRLGMHQIGGVDLLVAMLVDMQVKHVLSQGPVQTRDRAAHQRKARAGDRKSTRLNSSHVKISYAV